ncbi:MAG: hypothetical protein WC028_30875 [Candidatus Obscuribacterales bacterium]
MQSATKYGDSIHCLALERQLPTACRGNSQLNASRSITPRAQPVPQPQRSREHREGPADREGKTTEGPTRRWQPPLKPQADDQQEQVHDLFFPIYATTIDDT